MVNHGYIGKSDESHAFCHNYIKKLDKLIEKLNSMKNDIIKNGKREPPKNKKRSITTTFNDKSESKRFANKQKFNSKKNRKTYISICKTS